jgi:hypothetical protein
MRVFEKWFWELSISIKLIPFLLLYLTICTLFSKNVLVGDEERYLGFANNLLNGFYSPPYPDINLWNGPGYPAFIALFLLIKLPLLGIRLLNGFLLYGSLIICFKTFSIYALKKDAFLYTILLGLYFPVFQMLPLILTETLTWFLISLVSLLFIKNYYQKIFSWKLIILTSFSIASLAMTKIIFGYVIIAMLLVSIFTFLLPGFRSSAKKTTVIFLLSFVFCFPWLIYTYSLTNKFPYWTNSGSMSLYTMSTPFKNELGDFSDINTLLENQNHKVFIDSISKLNTLSRDEAYKNAALRNIKNHPQKYFYNWVANVGRLFFSYPYSNAKQSIKSYFTIIPNMFVMVFIIISFALSLVYYRKLPDGLILLCVFILIYLFGSTLVSAYRRMFFVTMPFWFLFISYVFNNIISVKIKQP